MFGWSRNVSRCSPKKKVTRTYKPKKRITAVKRATAKKRSTRGYAGRKTYGRGSY
jgi:hypothetical protein